MKQLTIEKIIRQALIEDMPYGDITTDYLIDNNLTGHAHLTAKEDGILAGLQGFVQVFQLIDQSLEFQLAQEDGTFIKKGEHLATIKGPIGSILKGERLALNILQRMSGIATMTYHYVKQVKDLKTLIVDTRKTTPNLRILEKEAVRIGGGHNHRFSLSDCVMIKDNHIKAVGSITNAVCSIKNKIPYTTKIEVEVTNLDELKEALKVKVDIIMLDNMTIQQMKEAVIITNGQCLLEASGNITLDRVRQVAITGVDVISVGALTHSVKSLDLSLNIE